MRVPLELPSPVTEDRQDRFSENDQIVLEEQIYPVAPHDAMPKAVSPVQVRDDGSQSLIAFSAVLEVQVPD